MEHRKRTLETWRPWLLLCGGVGLFYVTCTRLLAKTDDGHFLGILHSPGFVLGDWLRERYVTLSGRSINEALMMRYLQGPLWLWQLTAALLLCGIAWVLCRVALSLPGDSKPGEKVAFTCAAVWLILPTCMSAAAFWYAGSFTFLWPAAAMLLCVMPMAFRALGHPQHWWMYVLSLLAAPIAASQEQAAAATLALLLCLNLFLLLQKRWHAKAALPVPLAALCTWYLLRSPGAQLRSAAEAGGSYPAFPGLSLAGRLLAGFSNYAGYALFLSIPLMTVFLLLLYKTLSQGGLGKGGQALLRAHGVAWGLLCLGGNAAALLWGGGIPDQVFEGMFARGERSPVGALLLAAAMLFFLSIIALLLWLCRRERRLGLAVGLCLAAAAGCGVAPGFSGSLYASGQRIFFFSEIFLLGAVALLYGNAKSGKGTRRLRIAVTALCLGMFLFYVLGHQLLELPPMG